MEYILSVDLTEDDYIVFDDIDDDLKIMYLEDSCRISIWNKNAKISSILKDEDNYNFIKKELQEFIYYGEKNDKTYALKCQKFLNYLNSLSKEEFFSKFQTIYIYGDVDSIIKYIKENPSLKNFNIIKSKPYELSDKGLKEAIKDHDKILSETGVSISIVISGNEEPTKIEDFKKVLDIIDEIVLEIKSLNLSPFETLIYTYDIIRNRKYKSEEESESHTKSRDIASVLLGDKIVCAGFIKLFNTILNKLDIKCAEFKLLSIEDGADDHVESLAYIKDPKYNIDGLYLFDPTFECKDEDNSYLASYFYFAKIAEEMQKVYKGEKLQPYYKYINREEINRINNLLPDTVTSFEMGRFKLLKGLNPILKLLDETPIDFTSKYPKEELIAIYQKIYNYSNRIIPIKEFASAFTYVRALEYYNNPELFPLDRNTIEEAVFSNSLYKIKINQSEMALLKILDIKPSDAKRSHIRKIVEENTNEKRILGIKLTTILKNKINN